MNIYNVFDLLKTMGGDKPTNLLGNGSVTFFFPLKVDLITMSISNGRLNVHRNNFKLHSETPN